jgi:hypothetical protein
MESLVVLYRYVSADCTLDPVIYGIITYKAIFVGSSYILATMVENGNCPKTESDQGQFRKAEVCPG